MDPSTARIVMPDERDTNSHIEGPRCQRWDRKSLCCRHFS